MAVARLFADVRKPGVTPASFARRCDEAYRRTFAAAGAMKCLEDRVALADIGECVKRLKQSRFLIVGAGTAGQEQEFLGAKGIYVGFEEFQALYDKVDRDEAAEWGRRWSGAGREGRRAHAEWINKAGGVYLAMLALMKKHGTDSITMNCLGGFGSGQLPAYPCLGFMQILDDGGQGVCEAMPDDSVSMLMGRHPHRPGRLRLRSGPGHVEEPDRLLALHGAHQGLRPAGRVEQVPHPHAAQPRPARLLRRVVPARGLHDHLVPHERRARRRWSSTRPRRWATWTPTAAAARNCWARSAATSASCSRQWDRFGWHRVTVYGDIQEPLIEFAKALGLEVIEEA